MLHKYIGVTFSHANHKVEYQLFKSFCMSLYGCQFALYDNSSATGMTIITIADAVKTEKYELLKSKPTREKNAGKEF